MASTASIMGFSVSGCILPKAFGHPTYEEAMYISDGM